MSQDRFDHVFVEPASFVALLPSLAIRMAT